jgi:mRNA interferase MazF
MQRGEIWWASLGDPVGSEPGYRRPVLVVQSDRFNRSRISTVIVAALSTNIALAAAPGNTLVPGAISGLPRDSVVNVSQLLTVDKAFLTERAGALPHRLLVKVEDGLRLVLSIG